MLIVMARFFLIIAILCFIFAIIGANPWFSIYIFEIEPANYISISGICLLFAITFLLEKLIKK